jgi:hypothetical protein
LKAIEPDARERQMIEEAQRDPARFAEIYEVNFDRVYAFVARRVPSQVSRKRSFVRDYWF